MVAEIDLLCIGFKAPRTNLDVVAFEREVVEGDSSSSVMRVHEPDEERLVVVLGEGEIPL